MSSSAKSTPPALDYATPSTDQAVLYSREGDVATVVIRQSGRRIRATIGADIGFLISVAAIFFLISIVDGWDASLSMIWRAMPVAIIILVLILVSAWACYWRLGRPIVIELTPKELVFLNLRGGTERFRREEITAIECTQQSSTLVVWIGNIEVLELKPELSQAEIESIAAFLRSVVGLNSRAKVDDE